MARFKVSGRMYVGFKIEVDAESADEAMELVEGVIGPEELLEHEYDVSVEVEEVGNGVEVHQ
jgi:hypothetical protein